MVRTYSKELKDYMGENSTEGFRDRLGIAEELGEGPERVAPPDSVTRPCAMRDKDWMLMKINQSSFIPAKFNRHINTDHRELQTGVERKTFMQPRTPII